MFWASPQPNLNSFFHPKDKCAIVPPSPVALVALVQPSASSCSLCSWLDRAVKAGGLIQTMFCQRHYKVHPLWDLSWLSVMEKKCLSPSLWKRDQRKAGGGHNSQRASVSCAASLLPVRAEAEHFQAKCAKAPMTELGQHNKPSAPCLVRVNPTPCKQVEF